MREDDPNEFQDIPKAFREHVAMFHAPRRRSNEQDPESSHRISSKRHWVRFDRSDPRSFPPPDVEVVVETERGQTFSARFIQKDHRLFPVDMHSGEIKEQ